MNKPRFHPDSGFSLLEVLAAILIVTFFTTVAMQMLVISTAFKARAKEYATAANLIQQDLENIRSLADNYKFPTLTAVPAVGATTISLSPSPSPSGLANSDKVQFQGRPNVYILTISGGSTTISPGIITQPTANATLVSNTTCSATSASAGLGNFLMTNIQSTVSTTTTLTVSGVTYNSVIGNPFTLPNTQQKIWIMRNDNNNYTGAAIPYDTVRVNYLVVRDKNNAPSTSTSDIIAQLTSEVIPNASLQCIR
jgi:prepilin-type N-terminal cleavage/methylation domain-containing protein